MALKLLLIRHAESLWNAAGRWQGHGDPALSQTGEGQARALAEKAAERSPERLLCSDLRRARQTAAALGRVWGLDPTPDPRLRELDIGEWTGLDREGIEARDPQRLAHFDSGDPDCRPGGGESRREIRSRAREVVSELVATHEDGCVALVTHLGFIRALIPGVEPENVDVIEMEAEELLRLRAPDPDDGALSAL